jgi:hypothetical protein
MQLHYQVNILEFSHPGQCQPKNCILQTGLVDTFTYPAILIQRALNRIQLGLHGIADSLF